MSKDEIIFETFSRLYVVRQCKPLGGKKTREEDWLESILRVLLEIPKDEEVYVDLDVLNSLKKP